MGGEFLVKLSFSVGFEITLSEFANQQKEMVNPSDRRLIQLCTPSRNNLGDRSRRKGRRDRSLRRQAQASDPGLEGESPSDGSPRRKPNSPTTPAPTFCATRSRVADSLAC